jgi:hypothetical protein
MPGEALVVLAVWLAWLGVLSCCILAFFLAATCCSSLQRLGSWRAFCGDGLA